MRFWRRVAAAAFLGGAACLAAACGATAIRPCACYGLNLENTFAAAPTPADRITPAQARHLSVLWTVPTAGMVGSPPVRSGPDLYFDSWGGVVYRVALRSGAVLWRHAFPTVDTSSYGPVGFAGSPVLSGGRLFLAGADARVYALNAGSGRVIWDTSIRHPGQTDFVWGGPQVWHGRVYVGISSAVDTPSEEGREVALSAGTGRVLWDTSMVRYHGGGASVVPVAAVDSRRGLLVIATGNPTPDRYNTTAPGPTPAGSDPYSDSIVALRAGSGDLAWYHQTIAHDRYDLDFIASVNLFPTPRGLAAGDGEKNGTYYAVRAATGGALWKTSLTIPHTYTSIVATAAYARGRLFVPTLDSPLAGSTSKHAYGRLVALSASSGRQIWSRALPSMVEAAPVVVGSVVFVGDDAGDVLALRTSTGAVLGRWHFPGMIWGGLTAAQGMVIVPVAGNKPEVVALGTA